MFDYLALALLIRKKLEVLITLHMYCILFTASIIAVLTGVKLK
jgi:hypothetical protein